MDSAPVPRDRPSFQRESYGPRERVATPNGIASLCSASGYTALALQICPCAVQFGQFRAEKEIAVYSLEMEMQRGCCFLPPLLNNVRAGDLGI